MRDELNAQLLRVFAESQRPLADAQFLAQLTARLQARGGRRVYESLQSIAHAILAGLATGLLAPLRLRHARLMAIAAAVVSLWTALA